MTNPEEAPPTPFELCNRLTPCEVRALRAFAECGSHKATAAHLGITFAALNDRMKKIHTKFGVNRAVLAVMIGVRGGLIKL